MKAVYWLPKEDMATVKYNSALTFVDEVGINSVKSLLQGHAT